MKPSVRLSKAALPPIKMPLFWPRPPIPSSRCLKTIPLSRWKNAGRTTANTALRQKPPPSASSTKNFPAEAISGWNFPPGKSGPTQAIPPSSKNGRWPPPWDCSLPQTPRFPCSMRKALRIRFSVLSAPATCRIKRRDWFPNPSVWFFSLPTAYKNHIPPGKRFPYRIPPARPIPSHHTGWLHIPVPQFPAQSANIIRHPVG